MRGELRKRRRLRDGEDVTSEEALEEKVVALAAQVGVLTAYNLKAVETCYRQREEIQRLQTEIASLKAGASTRRIEEVLKENKRLKAALRMRQCMRDVRNTGARIFPDALDEKIRDGLKRLTPRYAFVNEVAKYGDFCVDTRHFRTAGFANAAEFASALQKYGFSNIKEEPKWLMFGSRHQLHGEQGYFRGGIRDKATLDAIIDKMLTFHNALRGGSVVSKELAATAASGSVSSVPDACRSAPARMLARSAEAAVPTTSAAVPEAKELVAAAAIVAGAGRYARGLERPLSPLGPLSLLGEESDECGEGDLPTLGV